MFSFPSKAVTADRSIIIVTLAAILTIITLFNRPEVQTVVHGTIKEVPHYTPEIEQSVSSSEDEAVEIKPNQLPRNQQKYAAYVADKYGKSIKVAERIVKAVFKSASRHGVDPVLVMSVIGRESRFNQRAVGNGVDYGLMQVNINAWQSYFDQYGVAGMLTVERNIDTGTTILKKCLNRYDSLYMSLRCYNGLGQASVGYPDMVYEHLRGFKNV